MRQGHFPKAILASMPQWLQALLSIQLIFAWSASARICLARCQYRPWRRYGLPL